MNATGLWKANCEHDAATGQRSANAILKLFRSKGGQYVLVVFKLFQAKPLAQLLYGTLVALPLPGFVFHLSGKGTVIRAVLHIP